MISCPRGLCAPCHMHTRLTHTHAFSYPISYLRHRGGVLLELLPCSFSLEWLRLHSLAAVPPGGREAPHSFLFGF